MLKQRRNGLLSRALVGVGVGGTCLILSGISGIPCAAAQGITSRIAERGTDGGWGSGESTRDTTRDTTVKGSLFTPTDAWIAGGTVLATTAIMFADRGITDEFRDPGPQRSAFLRNTARDFNLLGDPGTVIIAVGLYGSGRLFHDRTAAELGLRGAEALAISAAATGLIKGLAGRARPFVNNKDPDYYAFGRGFGHGGDTSFPSGHATATFALASVVASESSVWWPHASRFVAPLAYSGATAVALARIYSDKHWASDVLAGAGIGTLSGLMVVRYHQLHPHTALDRWLLGMQVIANPQQGVGLGWSIAMP